MTRWLPLLALLLAAPAAADQGEHEIALRCEWVHAGSHGGGFEGAWAWDFTDWWAVVGDVGWAYLPSESTGATSRLAADLGISYQIDAFEWVPYVLGTAGVIGDLGEDDDEAAFTLSAGGGLDWRPWRHLGVGVFAIYRFVIVGDPDSDLRVGLQLSTWL